MTVFYWIEEEETKMRPTDRYTRWKLVHNLDEIYTTDLRDREGNQIRVGDVIEYVRKKATGYYRSRIPAGTVIRARVDEIIVRIRKDYFGTWVIRAINVTPIEPSYRGCQYRIYNTNGVLNTTPPAVETTDRVLESIVYPPESDYNSKSNDAAFLNGILSFSL